MHSSFSMALYLLIPLLLVIQPSFAAGPVRGCKTDRLGRNYEGYVAQTKSGKTCQKWLKQFPHGHTRNNPDNFPDPTLEDAFNFCRNPDNEPEGPWCYTTDPSKRWEYCDVPYCECKDTKLGKNYMGRTAVTKSGKECQPWNAQSPHKHTRNKVANFPEDDLEDASNFCRNPDNEPDGPWCYTMDSDTRWEYCDVPVCDCKWDEEGAGYSGQLDSTRSGLTCQRWDSQEPHRHWNKFDGLFRDATVSSAENFCRNPDGEDYGPWCYTTDSEKRWEYCDIPSCGKPQEPAPLRVEITCKDTRRGEDYHGKVSQTISGRKCQRWDTQEPHRHTRDNPTKFPEHLLSQAENFCRNPDREEAGPWCYTTDPDVRWQYCDVPMCEEVKECKVDDRGTTYRGTVSQTRSGKTCQRFDTQSPHRHRRNNLSKFPDATLADAGNSCRNPDNEPEGPWCYTTDPSKRWEYCDIPKCSDLEEVGTTYTTPPPEPAPTKPPFEDIAPQGYERVGEYGKTCPGHDLKFMDLDLAACGDQCDDNRDCEGIVFTTNDAVDPRCWLKSKLCEVPESQEKTAVYKKKPNTEAKTWQLRLEGGPFANEGRLEVFLDGEWTVVCAEGMYMEGFVKVACMDMGYATCTRTAFCKKEGCVDTSKKIILKGPYCSTTKVDKFHMCEFRNETVCNHDKTVYIVCEGTKSE